VAGRLARASPSPVDVGEPEELVLIERRDRFPEGHPVVQEYRYDFREDDAARQLWGWD
jgi:hypothetical protein